MAITIKEIQVRTTVVRQAKEETPLSAYDLENLKRELLNELKKEIRNEQQKTER